MTANYTGCPKKKYTQANLAALKNGQVQWQQFLRHSLWSVCVGLCKLLNPYIMFYLSYERQKMVVSNMALHSFNLIIWLAGIHTGTNTFQ